MLTVIRTDVRMGAIGPAASDMGQAVRWGIDWVIKAGHPEVQDDLVLQAIEDDIHRLCLEQGWDRVTWRVWP